MKAKKQCHCQLVADAAKLLSEVTARAGFLPPDLSKRIDDHLVNARHSVDVEHVHDTTPLAA